MNLDNLTQEQQIMMAMRKVLTQIVRETAPLPDRPSPFSQQTIEDIRMCLGLISAREQELAQQQGREIKDRPHFVDEPQSAQVINLHQPEKKK